MPGLSVYTENNLLSCLRNTGFTVANVFVSLHTSTPGATGANEVSGGSYARIAVTFGAPSSGSMANSGIINVNVPASTTVSHFGYWDAVTAGNWIGGTALNASQTFTGAGTLSFAIGALTFALTA